ncbi:MAG TPA: hypothetical protein VIJ39_07995 [Solirubrobacteraceae bacterium]
MLIVLGWCVGAAGGSAHVSVGEGLAQRVAKYSRAPIAGANELGRRAPLLAVFPLRISHKLRRGS